MGPRSKPRGDDEPGESERKSGGSLLCSHWADRGARPEGIAGFPARALDNRSPRAYVERAMNATILIVEDDKKISDLVAKNLEAAGFRCHRAFDGKKALDEFGRHEPALIVLDLMIPLIDGLEVARRVRRKSNVPILMLTARSTEGDKVLGFEIGADDYLTKPFGTRELVARVRALLRRSAVTPAEETLVRGVLEIDPSTYQVRLGGDPVELTTLEFNLLYFLAARPGRVFSREALMEQVWGDDRLVDARSIDSLISRLRRKIEKDSSNPMYIQTVWGAGYRFPRLDYS